MRLGGWNMLRLGCCFCLHSGEAALRTDGSDYDGRTMLSNCMSVYFLLVYFWAAVDYLKLFQMAKRSVKLHP